MNTVVTPTGSSDPMKTRYVGDGLRRSVVRVGGDNHLLVHLRQRGTRGFDSGLSSRRRRWLLARHGSGQR